VPSPLKLIVGLGNPGPNYSATRHNTGFWFVDKFAQQSHTNFTSESKFFGEVARIRSSGVDCRLLKPETYMNESGRAVSAVTSYYDISPEEILVVHDEIDLNAGIARLKKGGGHGGNNGIRDIISHLGDKNFLRLRIGVGHPGHSDAVTNHVLNKPSAEDQKKIDQAIDDAMAVMPLLSQGELSKAMTELHTEK
jgi:PTH1 family peptidyl-tRNA hydrolase